MENGDIIEQEQIRMLEMGVTVPSTFLALTPTTWFPASLFRKSLLLECPHLSLQPHTSHLFGFSVGSPLASPHTCVLSSPFSPSELPLSYVADLGTHPDATLPSLSFHSQPSLPTSQLLPASHAALYAWGKSPDKNPNLYILSLLPAQL